MWVGQIALLLVGVAVAQEPGPPPPELGASATVRVSVRVPPEVETVSLVVGLADEEPVPLSDDGSVPRDNPGDGEWQAQLTVQESGVHTLVVGGLLDRRLVVVREPIAVSEVTGGNFEVDLTAIPTDDGWALMRYTVGPMPARGGRTGAGLSRWGEQVGIPGLWLYLGWGAFCLVAVMAASLAGALRSGPDREAQPDG